MSNKHRFSIFNFQLSTSKGFTLVEIMVVMAILIFIGLLIGAIIMSVLRGTNKTNTMTVVRQNGSFAIAQVSKMLRNARSFGGVSLTNDPDDYTTVCNDGDTTQYPYVKIKSFDEYETVFSCADNKLSSNSARLLDTDNTVSIVTCYFTCQAGISDYPSIGINFSLRQKLDSNLPERRAYTEDPIQFNTTVLLRNVGR